MHLDDGSGDDLTAKVRSAPNGAKVACFLESSGGAGDQPHLEHFPVGKTMKLSAVHIQLKAGQSASELFLMEGRR